jgi:hypothetical protein
LIEQLICGEEGLGVGFAGFEGSRQILFDVVGGFAAHVAVAIAYAE